MPRTCRRQTLRANPEASIQEEYYRQVVTVPVLDYLCQEMTTRFSDIQKKRPKGLSLLPSIFLHNPAKARKDIQDMADLYKNDLPMPYDGPASLDAELASWEVSLFNQLG